jgi:hypothetical protein
MEKFEDEMKNLMQVHFENLEEQTTKKLESYSKKLEKEMQKKLNEIEENDFENKRNLAIIIQQTEDAFKDVASIMRRDLKKSWEIINITNKQNIRKSRKIVKLEEEISKLKRD